VRHTPERGERDREAPDNDASIAVAGRLGMTPLREDLLLGEPVVVHAVRRHA
jgi:hypothetical protein